MRNYKLDIELNKSQNKEYFLPCASCLSDTRHKVMVSTDVTGEATEWEFDWWEKFQIVQCQGCDSISFRKSHADSESLYFDDKTGATKVDEEIELYPSRIAGRKKLGQSQFLPLDIRRIYDETRSALCSQQHILGGIGIRALIESVCKEKAAGGSNLEQKIDGLVALGVLTEDGAEILHSLRILGNQAAHEVKPHSEKTLHLALDVAENLLNNVYILPKITETLPKRIA